MTTFAQGETRTNGQRLWFEYHCLESHESADAKLWYKSHQQVTVISPPLWDGRPTQPTDFHPDGLPETRKARGHEGMPLGYKVRFDDGLEFDVFEDELLDNPQQFTRPNPPTT